MVAWPAPRYGKASFERSKSVSFPSAVRAFGPARFTAAIADVTFTIWQSIPHTAFHHVNHCSMPPAPEEVVVT